MWRQLFFVGDFTKMILEISQIPDLTTYYYHFICFP